MLISSASNPPRMIFIVRLTRRGELSSEEIDDHPAIHNMNLFIETRLKRIN